MFKRFVISALFSCLVLACGMANAQSLCPPGVQSDKLICLVPQVYGANGLQVRNPAFPTGDFGVNFLTSSLSSLQSSVAKQSSLVPLASPSSGITFSWDPEAKVFVPSTDSLGPITSERADTIGKHKVFLGYDYQFLAFSTLDGLDTKQLPVVLPQNDFTLAGGTTCSINSTDPTQNTGACGFIRDVLVTQNRLDLKIHQLTTFVTFGITNQIDVSVAIPIENVRESMVSQVTVSHNDSPTEFLHAFAPRPDCPVVCLTRTFSSAATASGIGDITIRVKGLAWKGEKAKLALGVDLRAPTGDDLNYLGSGAPGVKPFVVWSYYSRISPHWFAGFLANGSSAIAGDISTGKKEKLPSELIYSGGADVWLTKWLTVAGDLVGQQVFQARRTKSVTFTEPGACDSLACLNPLPGKTDANLAETTASFNVTSLSIGAKVKPFGTFVITGNALIKLNSGGLRSEVIPLVGISYTF